MLTYANGKYTYGRKDYDDFTSALVNMCWDATWRKHIPEFGDIPVDNLNKQEFEQYLLLRAMFEWDIEAVLNADDYKSYLKHGGKPIENGKRLLKGNPLWGMRQNMPMTYKGNLSMQHCMLPAMEKITNSLTGYVQCARRKYKGDIVLSLLADRILFNPDTTPFDEVMWIFETLESDKRTKGLCDFVRNEDLHKAKILALQVDIGDLNEMENSITVGDLRKARYFCKTKDAWGDSSYMETMLNLPPSMHSEDYYAWVENAGRAVGKDIHLRAEEPVVEPPVRSIRSLVEEALGFQVSDELFAKFPEIIINTLDGEDRLTHARIAMIRNWYESEINKEPAVIAKEEQIKPEPVAEDKSEVMQEEKVEPVVEKTEPVVANADKVESVQEDEFSSIDKSAAQLCKEHKLDYSAIKHALTLGGYSDEKFYRKLPDYIKEHGEDVDIDSMVNYFFALSDTFGSVMGK